eukprot:6140564-Pleurochrysis_carterae.AAC.1
MQTAWPENHIHVRQQSSIHVHRNGTTFFGAKLSLSCLMLDALLHSEIFLDVLSPATVTSRHSTGRRLALTPLGVVFADSYFLFATSCSAATTAAS